MENKKTFQCPKYLEFCQHKYLIEDEIGEGTFSRVFKARCKTTGALVAIKAITKTSAPHRIHEELSILKVLNGEGSCIKLLDVMRLQDQVLAVFPFVSHTDYKDLVVQSTMHDIKKYLYSLISAVHHMHNNNIIHRDIKPANFLFDLELQDGCLIDFGLAQFDKRTDPVAERKTKPAIFFNAIVTPCKPPGYFQQDNRPPMKAPRAGTRGFRAPEVLFKSVNQSKSIDMWSVGVILLCVLTTQYPFFLSLDDTDSLVELGIIFGHAEMRKVAKHYGRVWKSNIASITEEGVKFEALIKHFNSNLDVEASGIDLLSRLLDPINSTRIKASEALKHPFFSNIS